MKPARARTRSCRLCRSHHAGRTSNFFFQAEDGIRDFHVTGVQTCALPIWRGSGRHHWCDRRWRQGRGNRRGRGLGGRRGRSGLDQRSAGEGAERDAPGIPSAAAGNGSGDAKVRVISAVRRKNWFKKGELHHAFFLPLSLACGHVPSAFLPAVIGLEPPTRKSPLPLLLLVSKLPPLVERPCPKKSLE